MSIEQTVHMWNSSAARVFRWIPCFLVMAASSGFSGPRQSPADPHALVRQAVENELQARERDSSCWMYTAKVREGDKIRTEFIIETPKWTLKRLVSQEGNPLTPERLRKEDKRIQALISNPHDLNKQMQEDRADLQKAQNLFRLMPDAFLFARESEDGSTIRLSFRPNPKFDPPSIESRILRVLEGSLVLNANQKRLVELKARMTRDLEFVWGIIGRLRKGGTLELRQEQVEPGYWAMTFFDLQISGRIWFIKSMGKEMQELRQSFQRIPENISLEDAAKMAKRESQNPEIRESTSYSRTGR